MGLPYGNAGTVLSAPLEKSFRHSNGSLVQPMTATPTVLARLAAGPPINSQPVQLSQGSATSRLTSCLQTTCILSPLASAGPIITLLNDLLSTMRTDAPTHCVLTSAALP